MNYLLLQLVFSLSRVRRRRRRRLRLLLAELSRGDPLGYERRYYGSTQIPRGPLRPRASRDELDYDFFSDAHFVSEFRLRKDQLRYLAQELQIPRIVTVNRYAAMPCLALATVLWRLAWPNRMVSGADVFNRSASWVCEVTLTVMIWMCERWGNLLKGTFFASLSDARIMDYKRVISEKGGIFNLLGFLDCSKWEVSTPGDEDLAGAYSGHLHKYVFGFLVASSPDGLSLIAEGPHLSTMNDQAMFNVSVLSTTFGPLFGSWGGMLYADSGFITHATVLPPHPVAAPGSVEAEENSRMSSCRISAECVCLDSFRVFSFHFSEQMEFWTRQLTKRKLQNELQIPIEHKPDICDDDLWLFSSELQSLHGGFAWESDGNLLQSCSPNSQAIFGT